jgi:hypothetical protein
MFSPREEAILKILGKKKLTMHDIAEKLFMHLIYKPLEPEILVGNSVKRIIKKCNHHKLDWTLVKEKTGGKLLISKENV